MQLKGLRLHIFHGNARKDGQVKTYSYFPRLLFLGAQSTAMEYISFWDVDIRTELVNVFSAFKALQYRFQCLENLTSGPYPEPLTSSSHPQLCFSKMREKVMVKFSRYSPGVAQRVGRGIALLFHDRGTRRGWVVSSTLRPHFTPGKTRYPLYRRLGGPQGRSGRADNLVPTGIRSRTVQPVAQSLYRLSYRANSLRYVLLINSHLSPVLASGLFPVSYSSNAVIHTPHPYLLQTPPISSSLIPLS